MVLPKMTERGFGTIVNVGSFQSVYPCGLYAVYSASKSYVDVFSRALAQEYGPRGVTVQSLMPQFVVRSEPSCCPPLALPHTPAAVPRSLALSAHRTVCFPPV
jgi:NADP-dependent 3-hydroxy acid dehydrogenase YdfG|eukprot:COSAG01_NODE_548_length_15614_cov_14.361199_12_plen_103_part_00